MIELYGGDTPNVLKAAIMLEEIAAPYRLNMVRLIDGEQFKPEFLALNPLGKVPVIVDPDGAAKGRPIFESGAILIYLADTYAPHLLAPAGEARWEVLEWLMFQMSSMGPMLGQLNHFQFLPSESISYAARRYREQAERVYRSIDDRLAGSKWIGGENYSIADIAVYPWAAYVARHGFQDAEFPHLIAWRDRLDERATIQQAVRAIKELVQSDPAKDEMPSAEQLDRLFSRAKGGPTADVGYYFGHGPMTTAKV